MNAGWSPAHERAATLPFDGQGVSAWDARQTAKERRPSDNSMAAFPLLRFLYWIYERRLLNQLKQRPMPRHVGIILDGNRRHARKRGLSDPCEIYQRGAEKLDHILDRCANLRIPAVTLWVFQPRTSSDLRQKLPESFLRSRPRLLRSRMIHSFSEDTFGYGLSADSTSCPSRSLQQFVPPRQRRRKIIHWH